MTAKVPLVSVIMPVYNAALYVEDAVSSILNQTFEDFELLVFNDGSTDNSAEVIGKIKDNRLIFIDSSENHGYVTHLNNGLRLARGKYIARMDADDISLPARLEKQVAYLESNPNVGLCGTSYSRFGADVQDVLVPEQDSEIREFLLHDCPMGHPTVMFRKALIKDYKLCYDHSFMPAEDYKLWYDISKVANLHNIPDVLLEYRVHQHQISSYMNSTQRLYADKVRLLQLTDKGFQLTSDEQRVYCQILQMCPLPQTMEEVDSWRLLMHKIKAENRNLQAYDELWFDRMFEMSWNAAAIGIRKYTLNHMLPLLLRAKPINNSLALGVQLRALIKCIIHWEVKR